MLVRLTAVRCCLALGFNGDQWFKNTALLQAAEYKRQRKLLHSQLNFTSRLVQLLQNIKSYNRLISKMPYTIYDATIVASKQALTSLEGILTKAEQHADAASFPSKKLAEDMLPLSFQVQSVCKIAEVQAMRFKDMKLPAAGEGYDGGMTTYPEMHEKIKEVLALIESVDRESAEKLADERRPVEFKPEMGTKDLTAIEFSAGATLPNMYFHLVMTYAILRNAGVELGKFDYLRPFWMANIPM